MCPLQWPLALKGLQQAQMACILATVLFASPSLEIQDQIRPKVDNIGGICHPGQLRLPIYAALIDFCVTCWVHCLCNYSSVG